MESQVRGLERKVFIVAGGGSGIGAATAQRLAEEGAAVAIGDLSRSHAEQTAAQITADGGKALGLEFDITSDASVRALVATTEAAYGGVDGIHVNAADLVAVNRDTDALDVPLEVFDRTLQVNLRGHLLCTRHVLPKLLERGGGSIVYTSSAAAFMGEPLRVAYAVSKSGLHALVRHVASQWGKRNVRANAVAPGLVMTDAMQRTLPEADRARVLGITRSPRLGEPRDIAAAVAFLCSRDGEWINGQVLSVDGGVTLR
jgi:NAD(P)-dependent dehydrogenase (short-subunit alcohol dehydrogenase family)